jgi:hypothetical protein
MMRLLPIAAALLLSGSNVNAFAPTPCRFVFSSSTTALSMSDVATMAESGKPPASADSDMNMADVEIPTKLPSDVGMDYVPLATMLATGQLAEADQVRL